MVSASAPHQTFWDRIPHATSKIALRGKSEHIQCHSTQKRASGGQPPSSQHRASKRKKLYPMRSPLGLLPPPSLSLEPAQLAASARSCRMSLDGSLRLPRVTPGSAAAAAVTDDCKDGGHCVSSLFAQNVRMPETQEGLSRAFRLSFSDAYLRNPHEYVQALIDSESAAALTNSPLHGKIHIHRSRRSNNSSGYSSSRHRSASSRQHQGGSSSGPKRGGNTMAGARSARFHHLQVEQTMSENDDAHSVATSASDLNELADADGQVPASPERHKYQLPAIAASDSDVASTPAQQQAAACDTPASAQDSVGDAEREEGGKEEETPSCSTSPSSNPLLPLKGPADQPSMGSKQPPANEQGAGINEDNSPDQVAATTSDGDNSQPGTPEPESPLSDDHGSLLGEQEHSFDEQMADLTDDALASHSSEDNMPSYRRSGQDFTDEHDVTLIAPPFAKSNVRWNKADPIDVSEKPMADKLAPAESHCCSVLRILPEQYLAIKLTLLREGRSRLPGSFKKRDAQRLCRIDVNKTSKIYEWFVAIGWLPESNGVYHDPASLP